MTGICRLLAEAQPFFLYPIHLDEDNFPHLVQEQKARQGFPGVPDIQNSLMASYATDAVL